MVEFVDGLSQTTRGAVHTGREDAVSLLRELVRVPSVTGAVSALRAIGQSGATAPLSPWRAV